MAFALLMMAPDSAQAAEYNLTMSECDDTSFTVTWDKPELEGTIEAYHIYDTEIEDYIADLSPESTGFTTTDLIKGYVGRLRVDYDYTDLYGITTEESLGYVFVNTTPVKMAKGSFGIDHLSLETSTLNFKAAKPARMTGTQLALYMDNTKINTLKFTGSYTDEVEISQDTVYKYRVRTYYTNPSNGETYYGAWSTFRYFDSPTVTGTYKANVAGCKIKLRKTKGVGYYAIYISTEPDSGFKKTAEILIEDAKTKTTSIAKIGSKKMKKDVLYYIKVLPVIEAGDTYKNSDIFTLLYFVNPQ